MMPLGAIMIAGPFRSGTNLMKYAIERNTNAKCVFNSLWWKHSPVPTLHDNRLHDQPKIPMIVMVREPSAVLKSTYEFFRITRKPIIEDRTFSEYLRSELIVHDRQDRKGAPQYLFPTPVDYWNHFYWSWLTWKAASDSVVFVDMRALTRGPGSVLESISQKFNIPVVTPFNKITLPNAAVLPSGDHTGSRLAKVAVNRSETVLDPQDVLFIKSRTSGRVLSMFLQEHNLKVL